ncbi:hypothetical protein BKA82DRAFT_1006559 [Pisolithus tinctorius]|uniref:Bromo domain-containing protein n=1 Tax=Pisolithus tinctorius Marx 270 TaxID=870435 RepID=A0A0C3NN80_PISTI|nr:hypothetical protein BKA82DRAFT_1006559 [Pisolithus tinctorius]KIN96768.1 hypothetical protein M404DRAFT_1006559 [Pisolithus tinctorius Marx 270]
MSDGIDLLGEHENQASTSQSGLENRLNGHSHSGITLVLPSLKALKAAKAGKKSNLKSIPQNQDGDVKKAPRPVKLKPLREVLSKLIVQIKKKDDYAFFIHPVDPNKVPGYTDVIKNPMDFGTMTTKVERGKYRSLEEFSTDFRLVINNAKIFNAPGSIYYNEAERIESWGLEHISKASAHVIEYETNWNVEIENDDDGTPVNVDEEDTSTLRDVDGSLPAGSPAPSTTPGPTRRGRGSKKNAPATMSESLDAEGRLPGSKDGVGAFPPGSDWAEMMVALKIKGKRYKTKKERLRFEKEGPPYYPDGSLAYAEMEDPFSVLNVFVPDPPSRPQLSALYPPPPSTEGTSYTPQAIQLPSDHPFPHLATVDTRHTYLPGTKLTAQTDRPINKRKHWTIVRHSATRSRLKDTDQEEHMASASKTSHEALPADWGTFAELLGRLAADPASRANTCASEQNLLAALRSSMSSRQIPHSSPPSSSPWPSTDTSIPQTESDFWTDATVRNGWDYLLDVVYGGVDGFAYVRSLAEFLRRPPEVEIPPDPDIPLGVPVARYVETHLVDSVTRGRHSFLRDIFRQTEGAAPSIPDVLGPESHVPQPKLDPGLESTNSTLLSSPELPLNSNLTHTLAFPPGSSPALARILILPIASSILAMLRAPLDMAALLRSPDELARVSVLEPTDVENGVGVGDGTGVTGRIKDTSKPTCGTIPDRMVDVESNREGDGNRNQDVDMDTNMTAADSQSLPQAQKPMHALDPVANEREAIGHALIWSAQALERLQHKRKRTEDPDPVKKEEGNEVMLSSPMDVDSESPEEDPKDVSDNDALEEPLTKRIRLNLLALAKRAPLDKIAPLPAQLVPEGIRAMVPTT